LQREKPRKHNFAVARSRPRSRHRTRGIIRTRRNYSVKLCQLGHRILKPPLSLAEALIPVSTARKVLTSNSSILKINIFESHSYSGTANPASLRGNHLFKSVALLNLGSKSLICRSKCSRYYSNNMVLRNEQRDFETLPFPFCTCRSVYYKIFLLKRQ
jgi:hypothetical protein